MSVQLLAVAFAGLTALTAAAATSSPSCPSNTLNVSYPAPVAAKGWSYRLIANGLTKPRMIAFDQDGGLLVVESGAGLTHLTLKDNGGTCLSVASKKTLVQNDELNHGLAISSDGSTVYASTSDSVFAWSYDGKTPSISSTNQTIVTNMTNTDLTTRTLLLSALHPGSLLVSRGSDSDTDEEAQQLSSGHAQIRSFNISSLNNDSKPFEFTSGSVIGWGLRNSVGVSEHPSTGGIWSVENSVDSITRDGQDIHQDNPADELNFHGYLNGSRQDQGGNYGYPLCYSLWSTKDFPDIGNLTTGDQFPSGDAAKTLTDEDCNTEYVDPRLAFQAHSAPLDIKFNSNGTVAYVSFHGSWDSTNPVGYAVASIAFSSSSGQPTAQQSSTTAVEDVLTSPDLTQCPDNCFRPVGLAWDSKGRLWLSSDSTGEIFVLEQDSSSGGSGSGNVAAGQLVPSGKAAMLVTLGAIVLGYFLY